MMDFPALASVAAVYVWGVVMPGPNFVAITHKAVTSTLPQALALVAGVVLVNLFWATAAIFGVAAVFAVFPWIALAVKLVGAMYLVWFGLRLVSATAPMPAAAATRDVPGGTFRAFQRGVAVNIVNPKSIAFYAAVFSAATPRHVSAPTFAGLLGCVAVIASLWYGAVAVFFSQPAVVRWFRRSSVTFNRVCGAMLIGLGVKHALSRDT